MKQIIYSVYRKYGFADALQKPKVTTTPTSRISGPTVYRLRTTDLNQYFEKSIIRSSVPYLEFKNYDKKILKN